MIDTRPKPPIIYHLVREDFLIWAINKIQKITEDVQECEKIARQISLEVKNS